MLFPRATGGGGLEPWNGSFLFWGGGGRWLVSLSRFEMQESKE